MKKLVLLFTSLVSSVCLADTPPTLSCTWHLAQDAPVTGLYACGRAIASTINHAGVLTAGCWYFGKNLSVAGLSHKESIAAIAVGLGIYKGIRRYFFGRTKPDLLKGIMDNTNPLALGVLGGSCFTSSSLK